MEKLETKTQLTLKDSIPLKEYCPRTKYGLTIEDIIQHVAQVEDELNEVHTPRPLPKYEKKEMKWTPASLVGMAGNCIKYVLP